MACIPQIQDAIRGRPICDILAVRGMVRNDIMLRRLSGETPGVVNQRRMDAEHAQLGEALYKETVQWIRTPH